MSKNNVSLAKPESIFNEFTGKYSLSKTLRFALIPVLTKSQEQEIQKEKEYSGVEEIRRQDRVEKFFVDNKYEIFETDIERKKRYKGLKYYLTELHKLFIKDALDQVKIDNAIDFSKLFKSYKDFEICKNDEQKKKLVKSINDEKVNLAKHFGDKGGKGGVFQRIAKKYHDYFKNRLKEVNGKQEKIKGGDDEKKGFAKGSRNILLSQNVLRILEEKVSDGTIEEKIENDQNGDNKYALSFEYFGVKEPTTLVKYFSGWSTYFKNFHEIRGNLYKDGGRKEIDHGDEGKAKISKANAGQLTTRILDENFEFFVRNAVWAKKNKELLELSGFENVDIVDGVSIFDPKLYTHCLLQTDINVYNAKIAELNTFFNEKKGNKKIDYLKSLHKQLLLTDGLEDRFVEEILNDDELIDKLEEFQKHTQEKISTVRNIFREGISDNNLDDILLNENQLHFFCSKYFGSWSYLRSLYYQQNNVEHKDQSKKENELRDAEGVLKTDISLSEIKTLLNNEKPEDFLEAVKNGWFCKDFSDFAKTDIAPLRDAGIFKEGISNFENFVSFLQFDIDSLLQGRTLLSKKENEDKNRISATKTFLQQKQSEGERVDDLLLSKFSEDDFTSNIADSIEIKRKSFQQALQEFKSAVESKKKLARERDFDCKKAINEYCTRVSDINSSFSVFNVPEGVGEGPINSAVQKFKKDNQIVPFFNAIRNFITKRTNEVEKIKLNFDVNNLLGGWGYKTEEHPDSSDYKCRILRKDGQIYLGIVGQTNNAILDSSWEIMDYYQIKGQTIFGSSYSGLFAVKYSDDRNENENDALLKNIAKIIDEKLLKMFPQVEVQLSRIKENYKKGIFNFEITAKQFSEMFLQKTGGVPFGDYGNKKGKPAKEDISVVILKEVLGRDKFDYQADKGYLVNRIKEIMKANATKSNFLGVDKMVYELTKLEPFLYKISFNPVKPNSNDTKIKALFQIYCKDFSPKKGGNTTKNLHTLYFKELFSEKNKENPIFKLSGGAEIFFREKADDYKVEQWEKKDLKKPKTDKIPNKKRRFAENQILFHLPIVLNNINDGGSVNRKVHEYIQENENVKILGLDRGEKELVYYCLLDKNGKICDEPKSLNEVGSNIVIEKDGKEKKQPIDYREKLHIKENERMIARRSWTKIEGIKDLKQGYISNVVNEIANLMVNNKAFVCFEELNHGFKRDRSIRIEKGVYQRLENALVDKLGYLVLEKTPEGVRNALQLTPENKAIKYWGNQMGAIFYTDAKFTSKTCPHCGFRKRGVGSMKKAKEIKEKIESGELKVFFEKSKDRFRIEYYWNVEAFKFTCGDLYGKGKMEIIYSDVPRSLWNNGTLKEIFKDYLNRDNVELFGLAKDGKSIRYTDFGKVFNNLTWLRHTVGKDNGEKHDRISCPKCHFSTVSPKARKIKDGDANGAYNIARRGLMVFEKIRNKELRKKMNTKDGIKSPDLKITLKEWDEMTFKQWDEKDWEESDNERGL